MEEKDFALRLATLRTNKKVSAREMSLAIAEGSRTLVGFKGDFRPYLRYFPL